MFRTYLLGALVVALCTTSPRADGRPQMVAHERILASFVWPATVFASAFGEMLRHTETGEDDD